MATLNQIAYNIAHDLGKASDPTFISRVKFSVLYYRALLIRRSLERNPDAFDPGLYSTIRCLPMEKKNAVECPIGLESCQWFMRSVSVLPRPVRTKSDPFVYVGTIDQMKGYSWTSPAALNKLRYTRYAPNNGPRYFYFGDYLYVMNAFPETLRVIGIFEDPTALRTISGCDGSPIYKDSDQFPLPLDMVQQITVSLLSGEFKVLNPTANADIQTTE